MSESLKLVVDVKATLGEGPCWDAAAQVFYWVDIEQMKLHIHDPKEQSNRFIQFTQRVGAAVPRASGGFILAMENGFYSLDLETEMVTAIVDPEEGITWNRFNDGKCDAAGRFWAGTMSTNGQLEQGALYCLDTDLSCRKVLENVSISNGIAWSPDNQIMYFIDSTTYEVVAFDFVLAEGTISNKRVVVRIPDGGGLPDGMTSDAEGMLWVAQWDGWQVSKWNPHTGELLEIVRVPVAKTSSCSFGGEALDTLYITTASVDIGPEGDPTQPLAGSVFAIKTNVTGAPTYSFAG
ncbi:SMP-30/gluconolactonase/LRE family protein [Paenibacillus psychroresistens]|uniref:Regucalcin n=1 Tax=Paenibacillus psychroresistens TaxID=1778678 RepID=A0A6B8RPX4_9BACL|nr:SMP-30/gluconolactonase/LRE family protein [Paenibacillus psychroresistens]QGQ98059.1 SMP-30/gluconolactonase/LRE family protein [Paenibacillus psychroresistens]